MKTLKELVDAQRITGDNDITIILKWFCENNKEQEGIELIAQLSKSKSDKLQKTLDNARMWIPVLPNMYDSNPDIKKEAAIYLERMTKLYILGCDLPTDLIVWAKTNIPKMDMPTVIFIPMVEWLKAKYSIEFKNSRI